MGLERNHHAGPIGLDSEGGEAGQDIMVASMHAIERANGDDRTGLADR
jgi:hypothetical protein